MDTKKRNELGKSIKRLMKLNNYYNTLIRTNYNEEYYLKNKLMKNEMTQYNGSNIQKLLIAQNQGVACTSQR